MQNLVWKHILFYVFSLEFCQIFLNLKIFKTCWKIMVRYRKSFTISFKILKSFQTSGSSAPRPLVLRAHSFLKFAIFYLSILPFILRFHYITKIFRQTGKPSSQHSILLCPPLTFMRGSPCWNQLIIKMKFPYHMLIISENMSPF